jgi:hypothetical protein
MVEGSPFFDEPNPDQHDHLSSPKLKQEFPLFLFEEFDSTFPNLAWEIGMKSDYPEELFKRVGAAGVSVFLGSKSVDYIYKRYTKNVAYGCAEFRVDKDVSAWIADTHTTFLDALRSITHRDEESFGRILFEWTLLRFPFAAKHMLSCANRGSIFEVATLARMAVEQIAWGWCIDGAKDSNAIDKLSATKAVGILSKDLRFAGRLYGWLSDYAHWSPRAHVRSMIEHKGKLGIQFASSLYKAHAYILMLIMTVLACEVLLRKREELLWERASTDAIGKLMCVDREAQKWSEQIVALQADPTLSKLALLLSN